MQQINKMQPIFITSFLLLSFNAFAFSIFDSKLVAYQCSSEREATICNSCKKIKDIDLSFKVNVASQVVLQQVYENGKLTSSSTLDSCKVVNDKNWSCNEYTTHDNGGYVSSKFQMNNGVFSTAYESLSMGIRRLNIPSSQHKSYSCAK
jgi:hypothetical protein